MLFRTHNSYKQYFFPAKRAVLHSATVKEIRGEEGTTVTISPGASITRGVEQKRQTPHVARCELSDKVFEIMDAPESDVIWLEKRWRTDRKREADTAGLEFNTHQWRFLTHIAALRVQVFIIIIQQLHFKSLLVFFLNVAINVVGWTSTLRYLCTVRFFLVLLLPYLSISEKDIMLVPSTIRANVSWE